MLNKYFAIFLIIIMVLNLILFALRIIDLYVFWGLILVVYLTFKIASR